MEARTTACGYIFSYLQDIPDKKVESKKLDFILLHLKPIFQHIVNVYSCDTEDNNGRRLHIVCSAVEDAAINNLSRPKVIYVGVFKEFYDLFLQAVNTFV